MSRDAATTFAEAFKQHGVYLCTLNHNLGILNANVNRLIELLEERAELSVVDLLRELKP